MRSKRFFLRFLISKKVSVEFLLGRSYKNTDRIVERVSGMKSIMLRILFLCGLVFW